MLFVGCGSGRTSLPLVEVSQRFVGVDVDEGLLATFARRIPEELRDRVTLVPGELRDLGTVLTGTEPRHFGLVVVPETVVNGILDPAERIETVTEAARRVSADGRVVLQVLNPYWLAGEGGRTEGSLPGDEVEVEVHHEAFDAWAQVHRGRIVYRFTDGRELTDHVEAVALFPRELRAMAWQAGLEITSSWGATPGQDPLGLAGGTWHLVCRRRSN